MDGGGEKTKDAPEKDAPEKVAEVPYKLRVPPMKHKPVMRMMMEENGELPRLPNHPVYSPVSPPLVPAGRFAFEQAPAKLEFDAEKLVAKPPADTKKPATPPGNKK